jgi:prevent-host-death family protein
MSSDRSTPTTIPATKAHRQFADLIKRTYAGSEHFIVERDGLPVVAIISMTEYEELMAERAHYKSDKQEKLRRFQHHARAIGRVAEESDLSEEQLMAELDEDKQEVYEEYYGDNQD